MRLRPVVSTLLLAAALSGCGGSAPTSAPASSTSSSTASSGSPSGSSAAASTATSPVPTAAPEPPPAPERGTCRQMTYQQAVAPVDASTVAECRTPHTAQTFAIGELRAVRAGHLLAVDSPTVQAQAATTCPQRLEGFLGGTREDVRLSMLRAVWFTPTVAESDAGATWFRCDIVLLDGDDDLAPVRGRLDDVLATPQGRDRLGMCGTAEPGAADFRRTVCREPHTWRAISTVDLLGVARPEAGGRAVPGPPPYPGVRVVRGAGQDVCDDRGQEVADDALDYQWGYEWPTQEQWATGQTYGRCWAPAS